MAKVGIVMGSDSDMPVMSKAADILEKLGIDYEMKIISAHREPDVFFEYAKTAEEKGFKVIIAGAGMCIFPIYVGRKFYDPFFPIDRSHDLWSCSATGATQTVQFIQLI